MFKFELNGQFIPDPIGWKDISLNVSRDMELNFLYCAYEGELTFVNEGYDILYSIYQSQGFNNLIPLIVYENCQNDEFEPLAYCNIIISDCTFNIWQKTCKAKIIDDNWGSRINNNKAIKYNFGITKTKNGLDMINPPQVKIQMFNPNNGTYSFADRVGFSAYEGFKAIINYISDNQVEFVSDYFSTGDGQYIYLMTGNTIQGFQNILPNISLNNLYQELHKKLYLGMTFYRNNGVNYVRVEQASYFYGQSPVLNFLSVPNIEISFDVDRLYSSVIIGSSNVLQQDQCDNGTTDCIFGQIPFYTWDREEIPLLDKECNIDKRLDLLTISDFVIDSNVIEDILLYNANIKQWEYKCFFVSCFESFGQIKAISTDFFGIGKYWYNDAFTNKNVLYNWFNGIGSAYSSYLFQYLKSNVYANKDTPQFLSIDYWSSGQQYNDPSYVSYPIDNISPFNDDFGLWYEGVNLIPSCAYHVPFTAIYHVEYDLTWITETFEENAVTYFWPPLRYMGWTLMRFQFSPFVPNIINDIAVDPGGTPPPTTSGSNSATFFAQQGDIIAVILKSDTTYEYPDDKQASKVLSGTIRIYCTIENNVPPQPDNNFLGRKLVFEKIISRDEMKQIKNNPAMEIGLGYNGLNAKFTAWIKSVIVNANTGKTKFELINK